MIDRYINHIFTATPERTWTNQEVLPYFRNAIENLALADDQLETLLNSVNYFMVGKRSRQATDEWVELDDFASRAEIFERYAEQLLDNLANQILSQINGKAMTFDAIITTTSTGNLMPGLSYRMAKKLENYVPSTSLLLDLGNVGCTGGIKALNCATHLDQDFSNILVVSVEIPCTLINMKSKRIDVWQGNCTFGDGAAVLWVSNDPHQSEQVLKIEQIHYQQQSDTGFGLIRWGYSNYYTFNVEDEKKFNKNVREYLTRALEHTADSWRNNPHWAIHPAGILLLMRLARKLGIPKQSMQATTQHYERYSNMSSAGILHITQSLQQKVNKDEVINLITMGAGFNVIYGCLRKIA